MGMILVGGHQQYQGKVSRTGNTEFLLVGYGLLLEILTLFKTKEYVIFPVLLQS